MFLGGGNCVLSINSERGSCEGGTMSSPPSSFREFILGHYCRCQSPEKLCGILFSRIV